MHESPWTATCSAQAEVEAEVVQLYQALLDLEPADRRAALRLRYTPQLCLEHLHRSLCSSSQERSAYVDVESEGWQYVCRQEDHVRYLQNNLASLPAGYVKLNASRPWICYWIVHSLALLQAPLPSQVSQAGTLLGAAGAAVTMVKSRSMQASCEGTCTASNGLRSKACRACSQACRP